MTLPVPVLDDVTFERLFDQGRTLIPRFGPTWSDHNLHDPGITLVDLLAWLVDLEVYRVGRVGAEQRRSFAALLGLVPRGLRPAHGLIWPEPGAAPARGYLLDAASSLQTGDGSDVHCETTAPVYVTPARLVAVRAERADGAGIELNRQRTAAAGAAFAPFGWAPRPGDALALGFDRPLIDASDGSNPAPVSIGLMLDSAGSEPVDPVDAEPVGDRLSRLSEVRLHWEYVVDGRRWTMAFDGDSTSKLWQTGVLRPTVPPVETDTGSADATDRPRVWLRLVMDSGRFPLAPVVDRLAVNVLPVRQARTIVNEDLGVGREIPSFSLRLPQTGLVAEEPVGGDGVGLSLSIWEKSAWRLWTRVDRLEDLRRHGPKNAVYHLDPESGTVTFGNGVNGRMPPDGLPIRADRYAVSAGDAGNLGPGLDWVVRARNVGPTPYGRNLVALSGGRAAETVDDLVARARRRALDEHAAVTDDDLRALALRAPGFAVARAAVTAGQDPRIPKAALSNARSLVVIRRRRSSEPVGVEGETLAYRRALRRYLEPFRLLGESLHVVAPDVRLIGVRCLVLVAERHDPAAIVDEITRILRTLLSPFPGPHGEEPWPIGRDVDAAEIQARVRRVAGVAAITDCRLAVADGPFEARRVRLPATGVPRAGKLEVVAQPRPGR